MCVCVHSSSLWVGVCPSCPGVFYQRANAAAGAKHMPCCGVLIVCGLNRSDIGFGLRLDPIGTTSVSVSVSASGSMFSLRRIAGTLVCLVWCVWSGSSGWVSRTSSSSHQVAGWRAPDGRAGTSTWRRSAKKSTAFPAVLSLPSCLPDGASSSQSCSGPISFHRLSLTFHCLSLSNHCLSLTFHCLSLAFHCLSLTFH